MYIVSAVLGLFFASGTRRTSGSRRRRNDGRAAYGGLVEFSGPDNSNSMRARLRMTKLPSGVNPLRGAPTYSGAVSLDSVWNMFLSSRRVKM